MRALRRWRRALFWVLTVSLSLWWLGAAYHALDMRHELGRAAGNGDLVRVRQLLAGGAELNGQVKGMTALDWAIYFRHDVVANALLDAGARDQNALSLSIIRGNLGVTAGLIKAGVSPFRYGGRALTLDSQSAPPLLRRAYLAVAEEVRVRQLDAAMRPGTGGAIGAGRARPLPHPATPN